MGNLHICEGTINAELYTDSGATLSKEDLEEDNIILQVLQHDGSVESLHLITGAECL